MSASFNLEYKPLSKIRPYVERFWYGGKFDSLDYEILPDGCIDVVFQYSSLKSQVLVFGTTTHNTTFKLDADSEYFGIRFRPAQASYFVDEKPSELTNRYFTIDSFLNIDCDRIIGASSFQERYQLIESAIARTLSVAEPSQTLVNWAVERVEAHKGAIAISKLAEACNVSSRQLERLFLEKVGITPKMFCRIVRFQSILEVLRFNKSIKFAEIAAEYGYSDQAHFLKDFKNLCHHLPTKYILK